MEPWGQFLEHIGINLQTSIILQTDTFCLILYTSRIKWAMLAGFFVLYKVHVRKVVLCISGIFHVCDVRSGSNFAINYNHRRPLVPVILLQGAMYPSLHFFLNVSVRTHLIGKYIV